MIKAIILDKDGVLLDLDGTWLDSALAMASFLSAEAGPDGPESLLFKLLGISPDGTKLYPDGLFAAGSYRQQLAAIVKAVPSLEDLLDANSQLHSQLRQVIQKAYEQTMTRSGPVANGPVAPAIRYLSRAGYKLAVLTNDGEIPASEHCRQIGILDAIDMVVGYDSGFGAKPEPGGLLAICRAFRVRPDEVVMVGDTAADRQAAEAAGVAHFIGVSARWPEPTVPLVGVTHLISSPDDLPQLIEELQQR
jgi:phosphoglycolate phosphatase